MGKTISLGQYLFERIHQDPLNVNSVFGVPGDFNLTLLDKIEEVDGLSWKGNANELNASYAADGYSRVKSAYEGAGGFATFVTTFGVGELSALNGVAGSYAEHVGLLHVAGIPSVSSQEEQLLLHHTLGNGDFTVFSKMSAHITHTTAILKDPATAAGEIDRVIKEAYVHQRPTYLAFPANLVDVEVPLERLNTPLDLSIPPNDKEIEAEVLGNVLDLIEKSKNPTIIVDACAARHNATYEASRLIEASKFKFAVTPMSKGMKYIDESHPQFTGVYVGSLSYPKVKENVESSDLILSLGAILSDFNTGSFSYSFSTKNVVEFHSDHTKVKSAYYKNIRIKEALSHLIEHPRFKAYVEKFNPPKLVKDLFQQKDLEPSSALTQHYLWTRLSSFLKEGDVVISETGTSSFGIIQTKYPKNVIGISQVLWGSIGYSVGSALGAVVASEEIDPSRRVLLFVGDGSLQLTAQELSTMVRHHKNIYVFILNNSGYTIEKLIHGKDKSYNQIQPWNHLKLLETFNAENYEQKRINTVGELDNTFNNKEFAKNDRTRLVELVLAELDSPDNLIKQAELSAATNSK